MYIYELAMKQRRGEAQVPLGIFGGGAQLGSPNSDPISDQNMQLTWPLKFMPIFHFSVESTSITVKSIPYCICISDQNGLKNIPFGALLTYISCLYM